MKALELRKLLEQVPDDTEILLESQLSENEGEFIKSGDAYAGFCDPDDDRVDGLFIDIRFDESENVDIPLSRNPKAFPVLALSLAKTSPRSIFMEN